jgi:hypothetical protein
MAQVDELAEKRAEEKRDLPVRLDANFGKRLKVNEDQRKFILRLPNESNWKATVELEEKEFRQSISKANGEIDIYFAAWKKELDDEVSRLTAHLRVLKPHTDVRIGWIQDRVLRELSDQHPEVPSLHSQYNSLIALLNILPDTKAAIKQESNGLCRSLFMDFAEEKKEISKSVSFQKKKLTQLLENDWHDLKNARNTLQKDILDAYFDTAEKEKYYNEVHCPKVLVTNNEVSDLQCEGELRRKQADKERLRRHASVCTAADKSEEAILRVIENYVVEEEKTKTKVKVHKVREDLNKLRTRYTEAITERELRRRAMFEDQEKNQLQRSKEQAKQQIKEYRQEYKHMKKVFSEPKQLCVIC